MPLTLRLISRLALCGALAGVCQLPAKIVRNVEKTFAVQPAGTLNAKLNGGDIVIKTADIAEVRVTVRETIQADDEQKADELLKDLTLRLEQQGNGPGRVFADLRALILGQHVLDDVAMKRFAVLAHGPEDRAGGCHGIQIGTSMRHYAQGGTGAPRFGGDAA